ncbi:MAG: hypothetical protein QW303_05860 [Nitrososphaerota archaeon]
MFNGYSNVQQMIPHAYFDDAFKYSPYMEDFQKKIAKNNPLYRSHSLTNEINFSVKNQINNADEVFESSVYTPNVTQKHEAVDVHSPSTTRGRETSIGNNVSATRWYYDFGGDSLPLVIPRRNSSAWRTIILLILIAIIIYGLYLKYKKNDGKIEITECSSTSSHESTEKSLLIKNLERLIKQK